jgi:hypothetical protein
MRLRMQERAVSRSAWIETTSILMTCAGLTLSGWSRPATTIEGAVKMNLPRLPACLFFCGLDFLLGLEPVLELGAGFITSLNIEFIRS